MPESFTWRDGERLIRFGSDALAVAPALLAERGFSDYLLLTTPRALAAAPTLRDGAAEVIEVPTGLVDEVSADLVHQLRSQQGAQPTSGAADQAAADPSSGTAGHASADPATGPASGAAGRAAAALAAGVAGHAWPPLVALGGGRVIDTAKALAGVLDVPCAALPTTLSGAELTPFHRTPKGVAGARLVRPALVIADPALMTSQPPPRLAASAMNALAHALEALYTPLANPVCELAALRAAGLIAAGLGADDREQLALGAVLAGYASGCTGIAVHHAVCQTIVRVAGTPHAETNAVLLPHSARLMAGRAPAALGCFAAALGDPSSDPAAAADRVAPLAARCGYTRLSTLGVGEDQVPAIATAAAQHPIVANGPNPPDEAALATLVHAAL